MRETTVSAHRAPSIPSLLRELWQYRALIWAFAAKDLAVGLANVVIVFDDKECGSGGHRPCF